MSRVDAPAGGQVGARNRLRGQDVRARRIDAGFIRREEWAGLRDQDAAQLPAARQSIHKPAFLQPALPVAEGQSIKPRSEKALPPVVDHIAVIEPRVEAVGQKVAAADGEGRWRGAARVGKVARIAVAGVEGKILAVVPGDFNHPAVVVALRGVGHALDHRPLRKRQVGGGRRITLRIGWNLVQIDHRFQIRAMATGVRNPRAEALAQIPFQRQIPLLDGWIFVVDRIGIIEVRRAAPTAGPSVEGVGEGEQRSDEVCVEVLAVGTHVAGVRRPAGDKRKAQRRLQEASPAAPQDGLVVAEDAPCKAQPRTPVGPVSVAQRAGNPGLRGGDNLHGRNCIQ